MSDPKALKLFLYVMRTLKDANGRSNFNKSLQYGAKLAAVMLAEGDKKSVMAARFNAASAMVSNGRKLGFLGMWLDSLEAARSVDWSNGKDVMKGLIQLGNIVFYVFDNIVFLNKAKLIESDEAGATKLAMTGFWFAQLFGLVQDFQDLRASQQKEAALRQSDDKIAIKQLRADRLWIYNSIVVKLGNLIYSSNGWELPGVILGGKFSEKTCAVAGLVAGLAALYKVAVTVNTPKK